MKRILLPGIAMIAATTLVVGCSGGTPKASDTTSGATGSTQAGAGETTSPAPAEGLELVIGGIHPETGDLGSYGPPMNRADGLAVDTINEMVANVSGAVTAKFVSADTASTAENAVSAARKVVGEGASCLIGPVTTPEAIAVLNGVTKARKIAMIPEASAVKLRETDDAGTIFRIIPPDDLQGKALAEVVNDALGGAAGKKVAMAFQNSSYGIGLQKSFEEAWQKLGGTIAVTVSYSATQPSFESEAQKLTENEMDAIVVADFPETFGKLTDALLRTGKYNPERMFVSDALNVSPIPQAISPQALEGARGVQAGVVTDSPQAEAFDKLATSKGERGPFDAQEFDAVMLCYLAAVAANSTDPAKIAEQLPKVANSPGKTFTYMELPAAIEALRNGEDIDYDGVSGPIQFGDNGDTETALYEQFRFIDGKLTVEKSIDVK